MMDWTEDYNEVIEKMFGILAAEFKLKSGDISPEDLVNLVQIVSRFVENNGPDRIRSDKSGIILKAFSEFGGFFGVTPSKNSIISCPMLDNGSPDREAEYEVTAPINQNFLNAINLVFGSNFNLADFSGK